MAYDKIIPIHRRLDHCVDYARNEEKTRSEERRCRERVCLYV